MFLTDKEFDLHNKKTHPSFLTSGRKSTNNCINSSNSDCSLLPLIGLLQANRHWVAPSKTWKRLFNIHIWYVSSANNLGNFTKRIRDPSHGSIQNFVESPKPTLRQKQSQKWKPILWIVNPEVTMDFQVHLRGFKIRKMCASQKTIKIMNYRIPMSFMICSNPPPPSG